MVINKKITLDELNLLGCGTPPHLVREEWETAAHVLPTLAQICIMAEIVSRHRQDEESKISLENVIELLTEFLEWYKSKE